MATIEGLSVEVSAATAQFRQGISRAEDAAQDLSLSLLRLGRSADSTEQELDSIGRSAATSAGGMTAFSLSTDGAALSTTRLTGTLVASLIPALVTTTAALTPLIVALGGFAAIAGSIAGVGILGALAAIAFNAESLKAEFQSVVATLEQELAPVISVATAVLVELLRAFEDIIPELVPARSTLQALGADFLNLGRAVIDSLPAFVELAVALTQEFLPPLISIAENVLPQLPGLIQGAVAEFRRLIPLFEDFGVFLRQFLPELLDFGRVALPVVAGALGAVGGALTSVLGFVNSLDRGIQNLIAQGSLLAPVLLGIATLVSGPVALAVGGLIAAVVGLREAWQRNFGGIRDIAATLQTQLERILPGIQSAFDSFIAGVDVDSITESLSSLSSTFSDELQQSLEAIKPLFGDIQTLLEDNQEEFRVIGDAVGFVINTLIGLAETFVTVFGPAFRSIIVPTLRGFISLLDTVLTRLANTIKLFGALNNENFDRAGELLQDVALGEGNRVGTILPEQQITQQQEAIQQGRQEVVVSLQGGDEITQILQEEAETVVRGNAREGRRSNGFNRTP